MKILVLSTPHPYKTAGIIALDIYKELKNIKGNDVKLVVKLWDRYPDKNIMPVESFFDVLIQLKKRVFRRFHLLMVQLKLLKAYKINSDINYSVQDYDQTITQYSTNKILRKAGFKPDAIIVLFMQTFLSFKNLFELNKETNAPVFLYMMDMAPLTAGCHYAWDCIAYIESCGNCPAIFSNTEFDQTRKNWLFKNEFANQTEIVPMAGSESLYRQLQQSSLYKNKSKYKLLLPIDEDLYKPGEKMEARAYFNLPENKKIIFFGAVAVNNKRKGFSQLIDSLHILKEKLGKENIQGIHIAIAGITNKDLRTQVPFNCTFLGYLSHKKLAKAFQAADVFVCSSIEDSGPMMINQSIMCGTPVVAFNMGVALDLIETDKSGYLAKLFDVDDFANGIFKILSLDVDNYKIMCNTCREKGLKLTSKKTFINNLNSIILGRKL